MSTLDLHVFAFTALYQKQHTDPEIALSFATCEKLGITFVEQPIRLVSRIYWKDGKMILTYANSFIIEKMFPQSKSWGLQFLELDGATEGRLERAQNRMSNCISRSQCPLCA